MREGSTGIKQVAAHAGVSVGTVSNVLNRPDMVSEPTRRKVLRAIEELGFVRNESGRQLRAGHSRTVAYVVLDASNPFFTDVAKGIEQVARAAGVALYICNSDGDPAREADYLDLLLEQRVRGILITPVTQETSQLAVHARRGMPVVLVDRSPNAAWCSVGVDDVEGGELAVTHLCEQGHQRIAFVGGPMQTVQVADRLEGSRRALAHARASSRITVGDRDDDPQRGRRPARRRTTQRTAASASPHSGVLCQRPGRPRSAPADDA